MRRLLNTALDRDLRLCPTCRRPFVAPREVLASHADGNHVVELERIDRFAEALNAGHILPEDF